MCGNLVWTNLKITKKYIVGLNNNVLKYNYLYINFDTAFTYHNLIYTNLLYNNNKIVKINNFTIE